MNKSSRSPAGVSFLNTPVSSADAASALAGPRVSTTAATAGTRRIRNAASPALEPPRLVETMALASIWIGVVVLMVAGIVSLFAPLAA
ncbi:MAG: hypothetical protein ACREPF_10075 [Rhodanobacteraceae bacterium]